MPKDIHQRIADLIKEERKIEAIKLLRESTGIGLREAKEEVERLMAAASEADVVQPQRVTIGGSWLSVEVQELARAGRKIEAIKLHREQMGLDLKEAKKQVEAFTGDTGRASRWIVALLVMVLLVLALLWFTARGG